MGTDGNNASATSSYYDINDSIYYFTYDVYATNPSPYLTPKNGSYGQVNYYNSNHNYVTGSLGSTSNGFSYFAELNKWTFTNVNRGYGATKYTTITFVTDNYYSTSTVKYRNLKIYGDAIPNSFYNINIESSDNVGVVETRYAKGNQNIDYFMKNNGTIVSNNQIRVTENGTYTVFVRDAAGNSTVQTIDITNIV